MSNCFKVYYNNGQFFILKENDLFKIKNLCEEDCGPCSTPPCPPEASGCCCYSLSITDSSQSPPVTATVDVPRFFSIDVQDLPDILFIGAIFACDSSFEAQTTYCIGDQIDNCNNNLNDIGQELNGCSTPGVTTFSSPVFSINVSQTGAGGDKIRAWDGICESGVVTNFTWSTGIPITFDITNTCGGTKTDGAGTISFSNTGISINLTTNAQYSCPFTEFNNNIDFAISTNVTIPWQLRYRRVYNDWIFKESQVIKYVVGIGEGDTIDPNNQIGIGGITSTSTSPTIEYSGLINFNAYPTCRPPETNYCGCIDTTNYEVIDINTLDDYALTFGGCKGKPIDIDSICAEGEPPPTGIVELFYAPYSNTIPVISGIAYDTTNLPAPPQGKINVVKVKSFGSPNVETDMNEIREWVCKNLIYATVSGNWTSTLSVGKLSEGDNIEFDWPYNDLYWSINCADGKSYINLIPC
jgi:hypothetical protein